MTRMKKTRSGGPLAPTKIARDAKPQGKQSKKPGKGKAAGNRQGGTTSGNGAGANAGQKGDKRLGSKKPISLTPAVSATPKAAKPNKPVVVWPPQTDAAKKAAMEALENDKVFMAQLETLENGGVLDASELAEFEQKLSRYDWLIEALGLVEDEGDDWDDLTQQGKSLKDDWS
ncbi:GTPase-activating protein [Echinimonas agarilytica]|uniref:GTPase-activating protein n=1 Tax=Echinimonas agarilytica TaxID=1215918 RepID=A0AA41W3T9_9GAMM|nr:GTPase-activating protein [Echinimonas agarilytica]MCM2678289.1 GTPase-activating protein [Echinimonas agarilytica]